MYYIGDGNTKEIINYNKYNDNECVLDIEMAENRTLHHIQSFHHNFLMYLEMFYLFK